MSINVSNFRQEVFKTRLSHSAFNELLSARALFESESQGIRFDTKAAHINPLQSPVLSKELDRIRTMIDHESHVLILDGFKVDKLSSFKSLIWTLVLYSVCQWCRTISVIR